MERNEAARTTASGERSAENGPARRSSFTAHRSPLTAHHLLRSLLWPAFIAVALASFYVVTQPGQLYGDAAEYDAIARSILRGRFELAEEFTSGVPQPTMHREPGYPAFRALVYAAAGDHPNAILWLQALLSGLTVIIVARSVRRLDARWELPVAWLTALYPGFVVWAGQHYSEIFAALLAAVAGYVWIRLWETRDDARRAWKLACAFGLVIGALTLTKASFQVLPAFAAGLIIVTGPWRKRWELSLLILAGFLVIVTPWIVRNGRTFGQYVITYRTGVVIHTRALKAEAPWSQLATSYGSVLFGEAPMIRLFPTSPPIIIQLWKQTWDDKNVLLKQGMRYYQADQVLLGRGVRVIFSSPSVLARYVMWSGIDELRFFALTSPLSPKFGVELIANQEAKEGKLPLSKLGVVLGAHALQFLWWAFIAAGFVVLVRARLWRHPSLLFVGYAAVMYMPFDNIPRYATPLLPWIMALIVAAIWRPGRHRALAPRTTDRHLIEAANIAYHEVEAELYDASHPEILWCERPHWEEFVKRYLSGERSAVTIIDIAAGTGFVGTVLAAQLRQGDRYVATDISREMLDKLCATLSPTPFAVETVVALADRLPLADGTADIVVINSALHHFPDTPGALREARRVLKPGGLLAVMHEPNIRFARSAFFRQVARFASVAASRFDPKGPMEARPDYGQVFEHVNRRLTDQNLIREPLPQAEIQALVDVHSPTARGRYEEAGFDPMTWGGEFRGWTVERFETYNFLGKLDPSARLWRRIAERILWRVAPHYGSLFSLVLRKPGV